MRSTVLVALALVLASSVPTLEAPPPRTLRDLGPSYNSRHLSWFWNNNEEEAETFSTDTSSPSPTPSLSPTTKKPSRWPSWLSRTGSKIRNIASTVANGTGEVLKTGAKKVGAVVKSGYNKIKSKFSGAKEKLKVFKTHLKEKLEAGDQRITELVKKLGINVSFIDDRIVGASAQRKEISVSEILQEEGLLSNKSSHSNRDFIEPEISREIGVGLEAEPDYYEPEAHAATKEVFNANEDTDSFHVTDEYLYNENRPSLSNSTGSTTPATDITSSVTPGITENISTYTSKPQSLSSTTNSVYTSPSGTTTFSPSLAVTATANTTTCNETMSAFPGIPDDCDTVGPYEPSQSPDVFDDPDVHYILRQLYDHFSTMDTNPDSTYDYYVDCGCYH